MRVFGLVLAASTAGAGCLLPLSGGATPLSVVLSPQSVRATGHVDVLDAGAGAVFRFPLRGGVVASRPDSTLDVPLGFGLAVAADGTTYVSDYLHQRIVVYPAGARGHARPTQTIFLPLPPHELVVDPNGYMFVLLVSSRTGSSEIVGVAPTGQIVTTIADQNAKSLAMDPQGNLYVGDDGGFKVYANPETSPYVIRSSCVRANLVTNMAISPEGRIFLGRFPPFFSFITRAPDTIDACPVPLGLFSMFVEDSPPLYLPYIAAGDGVVFTVESTNVRLLQLDPNKGHQVPVADVRYAGFKAPAAVAVGP